MIKIQQLIHAKALMEQGNFRKAAQTQNISRPAFSRSIAKLEQSLGVKLFHRHPTRVTMTVYGQSLSKYTKQITTAASELEREINIIRELGLGELSIAMGPYPAELTGHRAIGRLISAFPDIRCKIVVADWDEVERLVINRKTDIGLAEISVAIKNKYLKFEPLNKHRFVFFCRSGHPLLQKKDIFADDLIQYPLVAIKLPERLVPVFPGRLFAEKDSNYMIPSVEVQDLTLSRQIVAESDAISACAPFQIKEELSQGVFSIIPLNESWMTLNYGFIFVRDRALSPAAKKYMALVRELEVDVDVCNKALIEKYLPT